MNNDTMIKFVKRWRDLKARAADLDFERSVLASDIRAEFGPGEVGDKRFAKWCADELGIDALEVAELLTRAHACNAVHGKRDVWQRLGGFRQVRHVVDLPKPVRTAVIDQAIREDKAVTTVLRERRAEANIEPGPTGAPPDPRTEAQVLAAYLRSLVEAGKVSPPGYIAKILEHYPAQRRRKAA